VSSHQICCPTSPRGAAPEAARLMQTRALLEARVLWNSVASPFPGPVRLRAAPHCEPLVGRGVARGRWAAAGRPCAGSGGPRPSTACAGHACASGPLLPPPVLEARLVCRARAAAPPLSHPPVDTRPMRSAPQAATGQARGGKRCTLPPHTPCAVRGGPPPPLLLASAHRTCSESRGAKG